MMEDGLKDWGGGVEPGLDEKFCLRGSEGSCLLESLIASIPILFLVTISNLLFFLFSVHLAVPLQTEVALQNK